MLQNIGARRMRLLTPGERIILKAIICLIIVLERALTTPVF
jgi:hypothetical protein